MSTSWPPSQRNSGSEHASAHAAQSIPCSSVARIHQGTDGAAVEILMGILILRGCDDEGLRNGSHDFDGFNAALP